MAPIQMCGVRGEQHQSNACAEGAAQPDPHAWGGEGRERTGQSNPSLDSWEVGQNSPDTDRLGGGGRSNLVVIQMHRGL